MSMTWRVLASTFWSISTVPSTSMWGRAWTTIAEIAELVANAVGYSGVTRWDPEMPDGTPRKLLDVSVLSQMGWQSRISLRDGIEATWRGTGRTPVPPDSRATVARRLFAAAWSNCRPTAGSRMLLLPGGFSAQFRAGSP